MAFSTHLSSCTRHSILKQVTQWNNTFGSVLPLTWTYIHIRVLCLKDFLKACKSPLIQSISFYSHASASLFRFYSDKQKKNELQLIMSYISLWKDARQRTGPYTRMGGSVGWAAYKKKGMRVRWCVQENWEVRYFRPESHWEGGGGDVLWEIRLFKRRLKQPSRDSLNLT